MEHAADKTAPVVSAGTSGYVSRMPEPAAIDFLRSRLRAEDIVPLTGGEWSTAFAYRRGDAEYVARFSSLREDFDKDAYAAGYRSPALPLPRILELGEALGGYYAISERVAGEHIDGLDEAGMRCVLPALLRALDAMRQVDLAGSTGFGLWDEGRGRDVSWRRHLVDMLEDRPGRVSGWREKLARSPAGTSAYDDCAERMRSLVDRCPEERHLIHSDLLHYNVLVAGDRITAVLDWGCSMYGDLLYDLAWLVFWGPWFTAWRGIDFRTEALAHYDSIGLDVPDLGARLRCYELDIGLGGMRYQAFKERWDDLAWTVRRTLEIARLTAP